MQFIFAKRRRHFSSFLSFADEIKFSCFTQQTITTCRRRIFAAFKPLLIPFLRIQHAEPECFIILYYIYIINSIQAKYIMPVLVTCI